jgi:hypothetical protein
MSIKNNPHLSKEMFVTTTNMYAAEQPSITNIVAAVLRLGCTLSCLDDPLLIKFSGW